MTAIVERPVKDSERLAVQNILYLASTMRGLIALADTLGEASDLSGLIETRKASLADIQTQVDAASARLQSIGAEIDQKLATAQTRADEITNSAQQLHADAEQVKDRADAVLADAKTEAARIVADARENARAAVVAEVDAIKRKLG